MSVAKYGSQQRTVLLNKSSGLYCETLFTGGAAGVGVHIQYNAGSSGYISSIKFIIEYFQGRTLRYSNTVTTSIGSGASGDGAGRTWS
jgi:hypothetical protein